MNLSLLFSLYVIMKITFAMGVTTTPETEHKNSKQCDFYFPESTHKFLFNNPVGNKAHNSVCPQILCCLLT